MCLHVTTKISDVNKKLGSYEVKEKHMKNFPLSFMVRYMETIKADAVNHQAICTAFSIQNKEFYSGDTWEIDLDFERNSL